MQVSVASLNCHTCGAPNDVDGDRFRCDYCGTTNTITATVRAFYGRAASHYSGPHQLVSVLTGLAHAIERIRSYTARQVQSVTNDLTSLQKDESAIQKAVDQCAQDRAKALTSRSKAWENLLPVLYLAIAIGVLTWAYHYHPGLLVGAVVLLVIAAFVTSGEALIVPVAAVFGAIYAVIAAIIGLIGLAIAPNRINAATRALDAVERKLADRKRQHNANAEKLLEKHSQMIAEMQTFLRARVGYEAKKDDIPIGIHMDEALSSLNDLTFGNIIKTLQECVAIVSVFERRVGSQNAR